MTETKTVEEIFQIIRKDLQETLIGERLNNDCLYAIKDFYLSLCFKHMSMGDIYYSDLPPVYIGYGRGAPNSVDVMTPCLKNCYIYTQYLGSFKGYDLWMCGANPYVTGPDGILLNPAPGEQIKECLDRNDAYHISWRP